MRRTVQVKDVTKVGLQRDRGLTDEDLLPDGIQLKTELTQPRIKQTLAIRKEGRRALQVIGQPVHLALDQLQQGWNWVSRRGGRQRLGLAGDLSTPLGLQPTILGIS